MQSYNLEYLNEVEFKKRERNLKEYSNYTYEKLVFNVFPELMKGNFKGKIVSYDTKRKITKYELKLPIDSDSTLSDMNENFTLHYMVYENKDLVILDTITPETYQIGLNSYKGIAINKANTERVYRVNLLNSLNPVTITTELKASSQVKNTETIKKNNKVNKREKEYIFISIILVLMICVSFSYFLYFFSKVQR